MLFLATLIGKDFFKWQHSVSVRGWGKHCSSVLLMKIEISKTLLTSTFLICVKNSKDQKTDRYSLYPTNCGSKTLSPQKELNMCTKAELQRHASHAVGKQGKARKVVGNQLGYVVHLCTKMLSNH